MNPMYIEPDYSGDEIPFDSADDDDDDDLDVFPTEDDDDESEIDKELGKEQNRLNEAQMSSSPFNTPSWQPTTGQQSTPFGGSPQPTYPWSQPQQQQNTNPWSRTPTTPAAQQPQMLVPTTAIRIERPKKYVIIDMMDGIIESLSSEGRPNMPPRAPWDIRLKFDVWDAIDSFSPQFVYSMVPVMPCADGEAWNLTFQYVSAALATRLRLPRRNCPVVTQGRSGSRKEDILKGILQLIPESERGSVVYIGIYSGYYNLGNEDLIAAKHCGIEFANIYQLIKGEI